MSRSKRSSRADSSAINDADFRAARQQFDALAEDARQKVNNIYVPANMEAEKYKRFMEIQFALADLLALIVGAERGKDVSANWKRKVAEAEQTAIALQNPRIPDQQVTTFVNNTVAVLRGTPSLTHIAYALHNTSNVCTSLLAVLQGFQWHQVEELKKEFDAAEGSFSGKMEKSKDVRAARKAVQKMMGIKNEASRLQSVSKMDFDAKDSAQDYMRGMDTVVGMMENTGI